MSIKGKCAIAGLGVTAMGMVNGRSRRTISSWSVATEVFSTNTRQRFWVSTRRDQH